MSSDQLITIPALCISIDLLTGCSLREIIGRPLGLPILFKNLNTPPQYCRGGVFLICCANQLTDGYPLTPDRFTPGFRDRDAKGGVAVQDRDAHLNLGDLAVEVPCHQALAG